MEREKQKRRKADEKRIRRLDRKSDKTNVPSVPSDEIANDEIANDLEGSQDDQSTIKDETSIADDR